MPVLRYLEAELVQPGSNGGEGELVEIPLADGDPAVPAVLTSPFPGFAGVWHIDSPLGQQPPRYAQVEA
jgi:hypothetical protein